MMKILLVITHDHKTIDDQVYHAITAVQQIHKSYEAVVLGYRCDHILEQVQQLPGVSAIHYFDHKQLLHLQAEPVVDCLYEFIQDYQTIVFASNTTSKNILPRLYAQCDISPITDVCEVVNKCCFKRPIYAGNIIETIKTDQPRCILSIRSASFTKSALTDSAQVPVKSQVCSNLPSCRSVFVRAEPTDSSRPSLSSAKIVVSGGRGIGTAEQFTIIYQLADALGAAVGASRAAVAAGFVSNDYQVGQTGKVIAPEVYFAIGISCAIQHLAGMRDSRVIIAINKDEDAPIFRVCDYGLVADLFDAIPTMITQIKKS